VSVEIEGLLEVRSESFVIKTRWKKNTDEVLCDFEQKVQILKSRKVAF
jgi:hypothetical protein